MRLEGPRMEKLDRTPNTAAMLCYIMDPALAAARRWMGKDGATRR
jgi:hypothetical protein